MSAARPAQKPLPTSDPITAPFWQSVHDGAMQIQRCNACGKFIFYPRRLCHHCLSDDLAWQAVKGTGTLYAFTIVYRHVNPAFQAELPYVVGLVELDEGVRMMSNIVDVEPDPAQVTIGMSLEVVYDRVTDEVTLPKFRPQQG